MYRGLFSAIRQYWAEYGGLSDLVRSPFTHLSFFATAAYAFGFVQIDWRQLVTSSLPTILGFSLAAYTITFTLMGSALHRALSQAIDKKSGHSLLRIVNSTFFHVIVFQSLALLYALLSKGNLSSTIVDGVVDNAETAAWLNQEIWYWSDVLGFFLSVYAFFLLLSVGLAMFRLGRISPSPVVPQGDNDDAADFPALPPVTKTLRFKLVVWLAKRLGLRDAL